MAKCLQNNSLEHVPLYSCSLHIQFRQKILLQCCCTLLCPPPPIGESSEDIYLNLHFQNDCRMNCDMQTAGKESSSVNHFARDGSAFFKREKEAPEFIDQTRDIKMASTRPLRRYYHWRFLARVKVVLHCGRTGFSLMLAFLSLKAGFVRFDPLSDTLIASRA